MKQIQPRTNRSRLKLVLATVSLSLLFMPFVTVYFAPSSAPGLLPTAYAQDDCEATPPPPPAEDANPSDPAALPNKRICSTCPQGACLIDKYINPIINALAAMVGVAVTISIIVGGIRYATSADNPQKVSEAKQRIVTSIFVLVGFFALYAFLNFVIPGGLI